MFAEYLINNYATNPQIKALMDKREIFIAPVVNVDGHIYDYKDGVSGRMWRKNRRLNNNGTYGVDLNRNYGFGWGTGGSSTDPRSDVYMGPSAFSEPESQAVKNFVSSQKRMTTLLSLHTFSELVLYPWGHSDDPIGARQGNAADLPVFKKMATDMASWNHYTPMQSSELYIASGDTTDWAYGELGLFAFTFELSPKSMWDGGFYPNPATSIDPTFAANLKPFLYLLEYTDNPRRVMGQKNLPNFDLTPAKAGLGVASYKDLNF
jgi:carboxypeptidase T